MAADVYAEMQTIAALDTAVRENVSIYALCDENGQARYVGKSVKPAQRLNGHMATISTYKSHKNSWLKSLGKRPDLRVLEVVPAEIANAAEKEWIALCREAGVRLTNGTNGGDGGAITDPDAKARIRAAHVGRKASDETRQRQSAAARQRAADPVERARLRSISNGTPPVRRGEANNKAKLVLADVEEIRRLASEGMTSPQIAARYGVTYQNIWYIVTRKTWRDS